MNKASPLEKVIERLFLLGDYEIVRPFPLFPTRFTRLHGTMRMIRADNPGWTAAYEALGELAASSNFGSTMYIIVEINFFCSETAHFVAPGAGISSSFCSSSERG